MKYHYWRCSDRARSSALCARGGESSCGRLHRGRRRLGDAEFVTGTGPGRHAPPAGPQPAPRAGGGGPRRRRLASGPPAPPRGMAARSRLSRTKSAFSASVWEPTETCSPAAIDIAPTIPSFCAGRRRAESTDPVDHVKFGMRETAHFAASPGRLASMTAGAGADGDAPAGEMRSTRRALRMTATSIAS